MPRRTFILLLCLAVAGAAAQENDAPKPTPRPSGILGVRDQRVPVTAAEWPWTSIGRVNIVLGPSNAGFCTGTLIGPRQVLTAANCLYDARLDRQVMPHQVHFVAGPSPGGDKGHSAVTAVATDPGFDYRLGRRPRWDRIAVPMLSKDWAILTLKDEIALKPVPWRAIAAGAFGAALAAGEVALPSYGADRPNRLVAHRGCRAEIVPEEPGLLWHRCDTAAGAAGAPVLLLAGGEAAIVGLHTSVAQEFKPGAGYVARGAGGPTAAMFDEVARAAVGARP